MCILHERHWTNVPLPLTGKNNSIPGKPLICHFNQDSAYCKLLDCIKKPIHKKYSCILSQHCQQVSRDSWEWIRRDEERVRISCQFWLGNSPAPWLYKYKLVWTCGCIVSYPHQYLMNLRFAAYCLGVRSTRLDSIFMRQIRILCVLSSWCSYGSLCHSLKKSNHVNWSSSLTNRIYYWLQTYKSMFTWITLDS